MFTLEELRKFYLKNLTYKKDLIYNVLDKCIDKGKSRDEYYGMLLIIPVFIVLEDKVSDQHIFSGIQQIWLRNAAIVVLERILDNAEDNFFSNLDFDLDSLPQMTENI